MIIIFICTSKKYISKGKHLETY